MSDFLWEDFLRLQHANLFPVVRDIAGLERRKPRATLAAELSRPSWPPPPRRSSGASGSTRSKIGRSFRTDMRHICGRSASLGQISFRRSWADVAEAVVAAWRRASARGQPAPALSRPADRPAPIGTTRRLCAVRPGRCGGRELGYASDIELMFVDDGGGPTSRARR